VPDTIISVENLGKKYSIRHRGGEVYSTLRDAIAGKAKRLFRGNGSQLPTTSSQPSEEDFWALRNVSFEVKRGEVLGIIGRNGAGKSTLLKILSRISEPTEGRARIKGRVASLLEVGTGFHPELTGRENIFLNGAILGMSRIEIKKKFDEIVAFSEIDKFLDTPVKRYSSGMYVRLAFAVAAHLEPDILVVDEVLAVGDAEFQKKCLGKMDEVAHRQGRTVLFVSHNMGVIQSLCPRTLWLNQGRTEFDGVSSRAIDLYSHHGQTAGLQITGLKSEDGDFEIVKVVTQNERGEITTSFAPDGSLVIEIHYVAAKPIYRPYLWISIYSQWGPLFGANMLLDGVRPEMLFGTGKIRCTFPSIPLLPQQSYTVYIGWRQADGQTTLVPSADVAHFHISGTAAAAGLPGEVADSLIANSAPVLLEYQWQFSNEQNDGPPIKVRGSDLAAADFPR
jgi:lipopolysaccharide transport system ATP-binding protein